MVCASAMRPYAQDAFHTLHISPISESGIPRYFIRPQSPGAAPEPRLFSRPCSESDTGLTQANVAVHYCSRMMQYTLSRGFAPISTQTRRHHRHRRHGLK